MLGTLNDRQIDQVLRSELMGHLGCSVDGKTYVVPMSYVYDGEYIYGHVVEGLKLRMLRANTHVCFQVERIENLANWISVIVWGEFDEFAAEEAAKDAMQLFLDRMEPLQVSETAVSSHRAPTDVPVLDLRGNPMLFFRIKVTERSGRFEKQ